MKLDTNTCQARCEERNKRNDPPSYYRKDVKSPPRLNLVLDTGKEMNNNRAGSVRLAIFNLVK
jgi:hypothetical protein